jgi:hypothetical protein
MTTTGALTLTVEPGMPPRIVEPIPDVTGLALDVLLSARLREFLTISGSDVGIDGHAFRIVGWEQDALVLTHACCVPHSPASA